MKRQKIILGIDPPRGWALAAKSGSDSKILEAGTTKTLKEMYQMLSELNYSSRYPIDLVRVELPVNKKTYHRPGQNVAQMKKIAHNVGENRARAEAIFTYCEMLGLNVEYCPPVKGGTKLSADWIKRLTGWGKRTNEHVRDAIVIAWQG